MYKKKTTVAYEVPEQCLLLSCFLHTDMVQNELFILHFILLNCVARKSKMMELGNN